MGIMKGTFPDEHWVSYVRDESLRSTPEAKTTLHVNKLENKKQTNKQTVNSPRIEHSFYSL